MTKKLIPKIYKFGEFKVSGNFNNVYIYEITIYRHYLDRVEQVDSKFFITKEYKECKTTYLKKGKDYNLVKDINLLSIPMSVITDNNIPIYESNKKPRHRESGKAGTKPARTPKGRISKRKRV